MMATVPHQPWSLARPSRRDVVLAGLLTVIGAASAGLKPVSMVPVLTSAKLDGAVPQTIGPWRVMATDGLVTAPADELGARLYDQILTRIYRAQGLPDIAMLIAYGRGEDTDVQLHRPDACYPAQGFALSDQRVLPIAFCGHRLPAQIVTATRADLISQVVFWTRIGDQFPADAAAERTVIVHENLTGRMPDAVLVRLSIDTADRAGALAMVQRFIGALAASLPGDGRQLLVDGFARSATSTT